MFQNFYLCAQEIRWWSWKIKLCCSIKEHEKNMFTMKKPISSNKKNNYCTMKCTYE